MLTDLEQEIILEMRKKRPEDVIRALANLAGSLTTTETLAAAPQTTGAA